MTHGELKRVLERLVASYFGTSPMWGEVKGVVPTSPLVVLNLGDISRHYQPIRQSVKGVPIDSYQSNTTLQVDLYTKGMATGNTPGILSAYENTAVNDLTDFANFLNSVYVDSWCEMYDVSLQVNKVRDISAIINDTSWDYRAMLELEVGFTQTSVGYTGIMYDGGMPFYDNGNPMYTTDGVPLYSNGKPMYNESGETLDENGNVIDPPQDKDGNYVLPPIEPSGKPPQFTPTSSGGGVQTLADDAIGWFEKVGKIKEEDFRYG